MNLIVNATRVVLKELPVPQMEHSFNVNNAYYHQIAGIV